MPSKVSLFIPAVYRKNLTRFAPLWAAYLVFWLVVMPLRILSHRGDTWFTVWNLLATALGAVQITAVVALGYAILVAMALHGWYYRSASVNALAALPIRREAWFCTNLLTALTMGLIPNLIVALAIWAASASIGLAGGMAAMSWLAITSLVYVFFYALAALCAAVAGQILALPALYILVNFTAIVVNYITVAVLSNFVYGMRGSGYTFLAPFSPAFYLFTRNSISFDFIKGDPHGIERVSFMHWGYLLGLTVAAVILLAVAFLLFRRRRMESAGDMIAVRPLRPVFKYCFAAGCALVLGSLAAFLFFDGGAGPSVTVMLVCLLVGGFVGYFTAEILLKKTFRVFGREWIGYGAFALCLTAAVLMMEFDVTGYERRVPLLEDVESIDVNAVGNAGRSGLEDPGYIAGFLALHQSIIQDKQNQESLARSRTGEIVDQTWLSLRYNLRNGAVMEREYSIYCTSEQWKNANSPARLLTELVSASDYVTDSFLPDFPIQGPENIQYAVFFNYSAETLSIAEGEYKSDYIPRSESELALSQEEAYELLTTCVIPDLREGKIGKPELYRRFQDEPRYDAAISFNFFSYRDNYDYCSLTLTPGSRTAQYFIDQGCVLLTEEDINAIQEAEQ